MAPNQNPEQEARDNIDFQLSRSGWTIQDRKKLNLSASTGVAVREYPTDTGPAAKQNRREGYGYYFCGIWFCEAMESAL